MRALFPAVPSVCARPLCAAWKAPLAQQSASTCGQRISTVASCFYERQDSTELDMMMQLLRERQNSGASAGPKSVTLVGTGPGDPGLLTLQAVQMLQTADVILYDRLVSEEILSIASPEARMVYVGKQKGYHSRSQEEIHELLAQFADAGAAVVRLKGGDPFVFGRGAEESRYLEDRGVSVHIVPGITAASGISALLGVPLTHRGVATSVRFLTGHSREGGEGDLDETISAAADPHTTLVVYMGLGTLDTLVSQLLSHGMPADVPALAVERGTTPESRLVHGEVGGLAALTREAGLSSPTLIIVGEVVALSPGWRAWERDGRPVVVPAPAPMQVDLSAYRHGGAARQTAAQR